MNPFSLFGRLLGIGGNAFSDTVLSSIDRANVRFILPLDSALYLTSRTRRAINEKAEWIWQNFGVVKEGVAGIARHTVGKGISLQIDSADDDWNQLAEDDFESYALTPERCDLAGRRNFYEAQTTGVEQRILRGEFLAAKTENPDWAARAKDGNQYQEPCFQLYDTEEISTPGMAGITEGKVILDGCELDQNSRVTNYHVRNLDGMTWTPIPRARMIHWYKPHAINQVRGISDLAQAVNPLVDIHELKRLTTRSAKAQQLIALVLKNVARKKSRGAFGAVKDAAPGSDGNPGTDTAQLEQLVGAAGAGIAYVGDDGDAKLITPNSPTPLVEGFITDLLMRDVCAGWGVPAEFFWSIAKLGGANTRFILSKADLLFQVLADGLIYRFCTPIAFRYLQYRIQTGALRPCKDPNWAAKMSWQTPPRVTVDNGNENKMLIELLANGMITLREFCNARGLNYRHTMRQWIREPIEFLKIAKQELADSGLDPAMTDKVLMRWVANMPLWRASKPGTEAQSGQETDPTTANPDEEEEDDDDKKKKAA